MFSTVPAHRTGKSERESDLSQRAEAAPISGRPPHQPSVAALAQSEERFHLLVDAVRDYAIFLLDPQGRVVSWNVGAERIKGYSADEVLGQSFSRFYPEEDRARGRPAEVLAAAARNGRYEEEGWRVRKGGSPFWADVVITALYDAEGRVRGFAKVVRDVSERREAERALRRKEAELAAVQRLTTIGTWEWDLEHDRIHLSDELLRILGVPRAAVVGHWAALSRRIHADDRALVKRSLARATRARRTVQYDFRIVRPDGSVRACEAHSVAELADDGSTTRVVSTLQDITERRLAETAFREAEESFTKGFDHAPIGMALVGVREGELGRFLRVNTTLSELTGYGEGELLAMDVGELLSDEASRTDVRALLDPLAEGQRTREWLRRADGKDIGISVTGSLIRDAGENPLYVLLQVQDVTFREAVDRRQPEASARGAEPILNEREIEVLRLVAEGLSGPEIGERLYLSPETVKSRLHGIYQKLGVPERAAAVAYALRHGLIE